jgi:hypothetical protein
MDHAAERELRSLYVARRDAEKKMEIVLRKESTLT